MALADREAHRLGHQVIGTEHILLGLAKEGTGVGANVLKTLDVDPHDIRHEVETLVKRGPDIVTAKRLPLTPSAKKTVEYAIVEARNLRHNYVGTEHLLLGLLREAAGGAAVVLARLGVEVEAARRGVLSFLGVEDSLELPKTPTERFPYAAPFSDHPLAKHVIDLISGYEEEKDRAVLQCDYEDAAQWRDWAELMESHLESLCKLLTDRKGR